MLSKIKAKYRSLKPEQQQRATIAGIVGAIAVFGALTWAMAPASKQSTPVGIKAGPDKEVLNIDNKILEKTVTAENSETKKQVEDLQKQLSAMNGGKAPGGPAGQTPANGQIPVGSPVTASIPQGQNPAGVQQLDQIIAQKTAPQHVAQPAVPQVKQTAMAMPDLPSPSPSPRQQRSMKALPPVPSGGYRSNNSMQFTPPPPPTSGTGGAYYQQGQPAASVAPRQSGGDIGEAVNDAKVAAKGGGDEGTGKKKEQSKRVVYLPMSFMEATTLNGLAVPATQAGRNDPVPLAIRIAAPAVLPNEVRANLKGCFILAEAIGKLNDGGRAHARLVSLSCVSRKGQAVIDQDITGYVQDADGGVGLKGNVVSMMSATIARQAAVGVLEGIGNGLSSSAQTSTVTALGQVSTLGTSLKDLGMSAAGNGIAKASKGLAKIYEDLTLESMPVVEVGNGRPVTVWITKGVKLEIKNFKSVPWR